MSDMIKQRENEKQTAEFAQNVSNNDLIDRQAAIDAIRASTSKYTGFMEMEMYTDDDAVEAIEGLPPAQPKPCEDAVSRADVLECFADLYDTFEDCSKGIINELHRKFEDLRTLPSAQSDRSLWFRIGEICVDESKGFISAGRAVEKIRELLREAERREDE